MHQAVVRFCLVSAAIAVAGFAAMATAAAFDHPREAALAELLDSARSEAAAPGGCDGPSLDRLVQIICDKRIRIGVRDAYPLFATGSGDTRRGYEIDVARAIAARLDVAVDFVRVKAATRIPMLADGSV